MDRLVLACIPADTPLLDALGKMRPKTRAIVVKGSDGPPVLVTAGNIMSMCNDLSDQNVDLAKIKVEIFRPVHTPLLVPNYPNDLRSFAGPSLNNDERKHFEEIFRQKDERYIIQGIRGDAAVVVTASEAFAYQLNRSYTRCTCVGDPVHSFEQEDLVEIGKCNKPHAVKVTCETVSGV